MSKYLIKDVKCGTRIDEVVVSVEYMIGDERRYLMLGELEGYPTFFLSDKDMFTNFMKEDFVLEEIEEINNHTIKRFMDIDLGDEYEDIFDTLSDLKENEDVKLIKYIIALTRLDYDEMDELIKNSIDHTIDEIEIPEIDLEFDEF